MRRNVLYVAAILFFSVAGAGAGLAAPSEVPQIDRPSPRPYYHLRVVRVTGAEASRGAALGCDGFCGRPIVAPAEEAWGTPAQLDAIAKGLGGARAEAVTGFIVQSDASGAARFEATVYPGETSVRLLFAATPPGEANAPHDLTLELRPVAGGEPLAEARVLAASQRTVAIAAPSPLDGEWVVLAVTALSPAEAEAKVKTSASIGNVEGNIVPPKLLDRVNPVYPETARREKREGKIVVSSIVDAEGNVRAPILVSVPEGCEDLAASVVEAVSRWRYEPATLDGQAVPVYFTVVVKFALE